ncbi:MAG: TonB-dependent receptor [Ignavibacteriales bacterium]|nr:TonB-dependent receptor [Ignavibacteriales bacterium]
MKSLLVIALGVLIAVPVIPQIRDGLLVGIVRDEETGKPLEGANIVVRGTLLGAASGRNGEFRIRGLGQRAYTIVVSMVGFRPAVIENVHASGPEQPILEVSLRPTLIVTDQIVVTASRREQELREVPASLSVITARALADRNIVTMDEAMRYIPGVTVLQDQINIRGSSGYSRGVGSRVLLLLDGLPFLTGDTGEINWETIPVGDVEQVEVIKGAGSALYGSSALGGVINVLTRNAPDHAEFRFRLYSGLYDKPRFKEWDWSSRSRFQSGLMIGYAERLGPANVLLSVGRSVDESYRENDAHHRWTVFAKAHTDLSEARRLSLTFNMLKRTHGNFFWWKSLREATIPADPQRNGTVQSTRGNISASFRETVSERFFYVVKGMYFGNFWRDDSAGHVNNVSASHRGQTDVQFTYATGEDHLLTFGVAGNGDYVESNLFGRHRGYGVAVYLQDEWAVDQSATLTTGIRYDLQKASTLSAAGRLSPKIGINVAVSQSTTLRSSLGAGFRYPSIGELFVSSAANVSQLIILPNLNLKPETSLTGEVGVFSKVSDDLSFDVAAFWNELANLIEPRVFIKSIRVSPSDTAESNRAVVEFENITRARIVGAEVGLRVSWFERLLATDIGYTALWPEDVGQGTILKFRARHTLHTSTALTWGELRASVDYRFISRVDRVDDQLIVLAPITHGQSRVPIHVLDLRGSYALSTLGLPLRIGLNVTNVLNYHYVELVGNLAPPRMYSLVLEGAL